MIIDAHAHVFETSDGYQFTYRQTSYEFGKVWLDKVSEFDKLPCVVEYRQKYLDRHLRQAGIFKSFFGFDKRLPNQTKSWGYKEGRLWLQWLSPERVDTNSLPEAQIDYMNFASVDKAVLQQAPCYQWPDMNEYLSSVLKRYPGRFAASAQIDASGGLDQINKLIHAVTKLHLTALKIEMSDHCGLPLLELKGPFHLDDPKRDALWRTCVELDIPVLLDIDFYGNPPPQAREIRNVCEDFPELVFILAHNARWGVGQSEIMKLPAEYNVWIELDLGNAYFQESMSKAKMPVVRSLYDAVGPDHLLWASDAPWLYSRDGYAQSVAHIQNWNFLSEEEKAKILGENAFKVYFKHSKR